MALCTFNGGPYLREQLDSIAAQTRKPDEIVICDDRSTDGTLATAQAFAREAPFRVRIHVNQETRGSTKNFEEAIRRCSGDIIALSDQDDVWHPEKLQLIESRFLADPGLAFVFSDAEMVDERLVPLGFRLWSVVKFGRKEQRRMRTGRARDVLLHHNVVTGATMALDARCVEDFLPISERWVHDAWIALIFAMKGAAIDLLDQPLIKYRQHRRQQLGASPRTLAMDGAAMMKERVAYSARARLAHAAAVTRLDALLEHMTARCYRPSDLEAVRAKRRHIALRADMPRGRMPRLAAIIEELRRGRYHRYSRGWISAVKDVFAHR